MPLSKEELLKPRWKVTANYPFSPYSIGDLVEINPHGGGCAFLSTETNGRNEFGARVMVVNWETIDRISKYPELFKPLHWWEERKIDDLPGYIKASVHGDEHFFKVVAYIRTSDAVVEFTHGDASVPSPWNGWHPFPATEEEYLKFKNSGNEQGGNN